MFIRYHLFYYAMGCLLLVLAQYFHPLFYIFLFLYVLWLIKNGDKRIAAFLFIILLMLCHRSITIHQLPTQITGTVIKTSEKYCYVQTNIGNVKLYHENDLHFQDEITASIEPLEINENSNDYAFNERNYLYGQKVFYKARLKKLLQHSHHEGIYAYLQKRMANDETINDYQRLFIFGEKSEEITGDYQQLSQLSLVHLFALSGMHIHLLYSLLKGFLGYFFEERLVKGISYLSLAIYIFSIPMQISLYRAFFVLVLYDLLKKYFNELDILSLLVILSLFYNPYIIYNISFVFSYFIYFIVLLTRHLKYSSWFIYLSSVPLVLSLNAQIPLITYFMGYFLTPFIEFFYCLCCFSMLFPFLQSFLSMSIYLLKSLLHFLDWLNIFLVFSKPSLFFIIVFYILYFQMICHLELNKSIQKQVSIMIALFLSFSLYSQYKIYTEITMIDVGQGDCTLIRLPMNQGNVLIDTGGQKDYDLARGTIIPYLKSIGIQKLDYVYISHSDFDHCGALDSLKENFSIGQVIDKYEKTRTIGDMKVEMLKSSNEYMDENDQSLVMYVSLPYQKILFTGDASVHVEKDLYAQLAKYDVDILKVSHHGSQSATSPLLLQAIHPDIAMIGVKKNNMYHHPSISVIERLKRKNIEILRTDEDGMFHIRFYGKSRYIFR